MVSMNWFHRIDRNIPFRVTAATRAVVSVSPMMRIVQNVPEFPLSPRKMATSALSALG